MRRLLPVAVLALIAVAFLAGYAVRGQLAIETSPAALHAWMTGLGWKGGALFLGVLVFRQFLLLPAVVVLTAGGLCFGAGIGTALGTLGLVLSAIMKFSLARWAGRDWVRARFGESVHARRIGRLGPVVIGVCTAHPLGPLSPFHWAAGLSSIPLTAFVVAVVLGSPVRAFAYSFFGAALLDTAAPQLLAATAVLGLLAVVPLLHPSVRRWVLGWRSA